jgi:hypothetical protein
MGRLRQPVVLLVFALLRADAVPELPGECRGSSKIKDYTAAKCNWTVRGDNTSSSVSSPAGSKVNIHRIFYIIKLLDQLEISGPTL